MPGAAETARRQGEAVGALLELAEVLGARHDLLARVAALVEVHPADQLVVEHLGDELFLGGRGDQRQAGADHAQLPGRGAGTHRAGGDERVEERGRGLGGDGEHEALRAEADAAHARGGHRLAHVLGGERGAGRLRDRRGLRAGEPDQRGVGAGVGELDLAAQHVHRELLQEGRQDVGRERERMAAFLGPHQEARDHAALGRIEAVPGRGVGLHVLDVVRHQVVQEGGGVRALRADRAEVQQRHRDGRGLGRARFVGGRGEGDGAGGVVERGAHAGEVFGPGSHGLGSGNLGWGSGARRRRGRARAAVL